MTNTEFADSIAKAAPGNGTYAGARKLYLARGLGMTLIERLRAVEGMAETVQLLRRATKSSHARTERTQP